MIEANDIYVIEALREIGVEDAKKHLEFLRKLRGCRIYFRKKPSEYEEIREIYKKMTAAGTSRETAVAELARLFDKSRRRIKEITAKQGSLFDD